MVIAKINRRIKACQNELERYSVDSLGMGSLYSDRIMACAEELYRLTVIKEAGYDAIMAELARPLTSNNNGLNTIITPTPTYRPPTISQPASRPASRSASRSTPYSTPSSTSSPPPKLASDDYLNQHRLCSILNDVKTDDESSNEQVIPPVPSVPVYISIKRFRNILD